MQFTQQLEAVLAPLANADRAAPMRAYMKDQFAFLGIPTPARRAALAPLLRRFEHAGAEEMLRAAAELWELPQREYQYAALDLLARHWKKLAPAHVGVLMDLAGRKPWWDTVDALASIIGDVVRVNRACQPNMDAALASEDLWARRVAMLHQLGWRGDTDTARLFAYARILAPEKDFFIRKAIGWALRDYAHHDPATVGAFLAEQATHLSPLTLREAGKHLQK